MPLEKEDIERLKEIFITRKECEKQMGDVESKINNDSVRLAVIEHQLKNITWLLTTVGACVVTMLLKMFWG